MPSKRIEWVAPDLNPWENPKTGKTTYFVNVYFDDLDSGSIGKQNEDKALEVKGLLEESVGKTLEFDLESKGKKNKKDGDDWKIKAFGDYKPAPYIPSGIPQTSGYLTPIGQAAKEHDIRRAVALKAAAIAAQGLDTKRILVMAEEFEAWLKTSAGPSLPADKAEGVQTDPSAPSATTSSPVAQPTGAETPAGGEDRGGQGLGEGSCPPHQLNLDVAAKAGRYPCRKCGAWINPRGGITE